MRSNTHRGYVVIGILFVMLFFSVSYVALVWRSALLRQEANIALASGLMQVRNALQKYAVANKASFAAGKTIMYVDDQYAPTIQELTTLGHFISTGVDVNPYGAAYKTKIKLESTGAISGYAYLTGSVKNSNGVVDPQKACSIASALGDIGLCSNPVNPLLLGNRTTQVANPTGLPAVIGALIFVSP